MNIYLDLEVIKKVVAESVCAKHAIKTLGIARGTFNKYIAKHNISIEHFNPYHYRHGHTLEVRKCKYCNTEFECRPCEKYQYCTRSCANRDRDITKETKQKISNGLKKYSTTRKQLGIDAPTRKVHKQKVCPICNKIFTYSPCYKNKVYCSKTCYLNDKEAKFRKKAPGGYRKGSGHGKSGYYKGFWCDSTYELAYIIYNLDHNIPIQRNTTRFPYIWNEKEYVYIPDFIVNGELVEIKAFHSKLTDAKIKAVNVPIKILYTEDLKEIFEYVENKTGLPVLRVYELYDGHIPTYTYICSGCGKEFKTNIKRKSEKKYCCVKCINPTHLH